LRGIGTRAYWDDCYCFRSTSTGTEPSMRRHKYRGLIFRRGEKGCQWFSARLPHIGSLENVA
jgi:hypothetical protein